MNAREIPRVIVPPPVKLAPPSIRGSIPTYLDMRINASAVRVPAKPRI